MRKSILVYTAAMAVMLFAAGCDKQEVKLAAPQPEYSVEAGTYTFTWAPVADAKMYPYELSSSDGTVVSKGAKTSGNESVSFTDLVVGESYEFSVFSRAMVGSGILDSDPATVSFVAKTPAPAFAGSAVTDAGACVTWTSSADKFAYRIVKKGDEGNNLLSETITDTYITVKGLLASTTYVVYVKALAEKEELSSEESSFEFTTQEAATKPFVAVTFEYVVFAEKNTLVCHNVPNSKVKDYFTTTENVNVIGKGYATESQLAYYIVSDYEEHMPGVYCNTPIHKFNNLGQGWKAGNNLFYAAVGEDKNGNDVLNWFWLEMPAAPGDEVKILDSKAK